MKNQINIRFTLSQNTNVTFNADGIAQAENCAYKHTIALQITNNQMSFGQLGGFLANRFFRFVLKAKSTGYGLNLRLPFDFSIEADGIEIADTMKLSEECRHQIRVGTTERGQKRFARLMALSLHSALESYANTFAWGDLLDDSTCHEFSNLWAEVRGLLDAPLTEVVGCVSEEA